MESTHSFGYWVRRRRKALDLTQRELAMRVGCAVVTIKKIEADQRRPSEQMANRLAGALSLLDDERDAFLLAAGGKRTIDQLPLAARPVKASPFSNLPAPLTSFVDRVNEVAAVRATLTKPDVRLLTLLGPPGVGKTRLSLQAAPTLAGEFPAGIWFVPLAAISDPMLVLPTIAHTLRLALAGADSVAGRLKAYFGRRPVLLVLDNFEQILAAGPDVTDLLRACAGLKVLVTSREPLRVNGEHEFQVPPLPLPNTLDYASVSANEAVRLFQMRVQAFQPDFRLSSAELGSVIAICDRVEGLPLGIELAAAQVRYSSVAELAGQLGQLGADYLELLAQGPRDTTARQRSLAGAIAWSFHLLSENEQRAMRLLATFRGGCSLTAFKRVCAADSEIGRRLLDHNLIYAGGADHPDRYQMLVPIQAYSQEQLRAFGEEFEARSAHASYFANLVVEAQHYFHSAEQLAWLEEVELERDNIRAALAWFQDHEPERGLHMTSAMWPFWYLWGHYDEGIKWLTAMLGRASARADARPASLLGLGTLIQRRGRPDEAEPHLRQAIDLYQNRADLKGLADATQRLAENRSAQGRRDEAESLTRQALDLFRSADDPLGISWSLSSLAANARMRGDFADSQELMAESIHQGHLAGDRRHLAWILALAANSDRGLGDLPAMRAHTDEALGLFTQVKDRPGEAFARYLAGQQARLAGEYQQARRTLILALAVAQEVGHYQASCLWELALLYMAQGEQRRGVQLASLALALEPELERRQNPDEQEEWYERLARAGQILGEKEYEAAWLVGRQLSIDEVLSDASN